jgi:UTP--glucose-1-phosphate uridylyltransferase
MNIRKAVIPIAGKGTRFLPATKQTPKEILPILNVPMIHYVVEEAVKSGIEQVVFVTSYGKEQVENYFDRNIELEKFLENNKKFEMLEMIQKIGQMVEITTVRQKQQLGLGHAVLTAQSVIGDENFAVLLGDDLIFNNIPVTRQLIDISAANKNCSVIGVMEVDNDQTNKYGIVAGAKIDDKTLKMTKMVEKPDPKDAPSNLATPGRYILNSDIFEILKTIPRGAGGEYQLSDAINMLCEKQDVYAHIFEGDRFDTGSINGYLDATIELALRDENLKDFTLELIKKKLKHYEK